MTVILLEEARAWLAQRRGPDPEVAIGKAQDFTPEQRAAAESYERLWAKTRRWVDPNVRWQARAMLDRLRLVLTNQERAVVELVACRERNFRWVSEVTGKPKDELKALYRSGLEKLVPFFERRAG
jgi:DNA-directed RNA polymerase specialized sigma24 family protein